MYHYTDQSGLIGILKTWEIWATKIQYLNDTSEFSLALTLASDTLDAAYKLNRFKKHSWFLEMLSESIQSMERINIFVASFSEDPDSLSQWRAYGGRSSGYGIGFLSSALSAAAIENDFLLAKCIYKEHLQHSLVRELVDSFLEYGVNVFPASLVDPDHDPKVEDILYRFESQLLRTAPLLKNNHFADEREWRLVSDVFGSSHPRVSFRPGTSMITPYYRLSLSSKKIRKRVHQVVVGPTPHMRYAIASVRMCTTACKVECGKVIRSQIPFRNW